MDSDLQDALKYLLKFIEKWKEDTIVYMPFVKKRDESQVQIPLNGGYFCLMDRKVVNALKQFPERHRFICGLRSWVVFRQIGILQNRPARQDQSQIKHGLKKLFHIGFDGILAFSYVPMRCAIWVGGLSSILGFFFRTQDPI